MSLTEHYTDVKPFRHGVLKSSGSSLPGQEVQITGKDLEDMETWDAVYSANSNLYCRNTTFHTRPRGLVWGFRELVRVLGSVVGTK